MQAVVGTAGANGIVPLVLDALAGVTDRSVTVAEVGPHSDGLLDILIAHERVIVVEEMQCGCPAGSVYRFSLRQYGSLGAVNEHAGMLSIVDLAAMAASVGHVAEVLFLGIEPEQDSSRAERTRDSLARAVAGLVAAELGNSRAKVA